MRSIHFVKLYCRNCRSKTCAKKPIGSYATEKEGCTKEVSAIDGNKYFHYVIEVIPHIKDFNNSTLYDEAEDFLEYISDLPAGERFK